MISSRMVKTLHLDVDVSDEVVSEVVAHVHLGNFPEFAELLVHLFEEVFELFSGGWVGAGLRVVL